MSQGVVLQPSVPLDIVVIDDDDLTLEIVAWILRRTAITHRLFFDPADAMKLLCDCIPRILVIDYYMPQINGIDFIRQLGSEVSLTDCSLHLCSAIEPVGSQLLQLRDLGVNILDKATICDRRALTAFIESEKRLTDYSEGALR